MHTKGRSSRAFLGTVGLLVLLGSVFQVPAQPPPEKVQLSVLVVSSVTRQPVQAAFVTCQRIRADNEPVQTRQLSGRTDAEGKVALGLVEEGSYSFLISKELFLQAHVTVAVNVENHEVKISLTPCCRLQGLIHRADGRPLRNSEVSMGFNYAVPGDSGSAAMASWGTDSRSATTDSSGQFEMTVCYAGNVVLFAFSPENGFGISKEVVTKPGEVVKGADIVLKEGQSLVVTVTEAKTGNPIGGAKVSLDASGTGWGISSEKPVDKESDAEGSCRFAGLPPGAYYVTVSSTGYQQVAGRARVLLFPGETESRWKVSLAPNPDSLLVSGRVFMPGGDEPLQDRSIELMFFRSDYSNYSGFQLVPRVSRSLESGAYSTYFPKTNPDWSLLARVPEIGWALLTPLTIDKGTTGEVRNVDLHLQPGATVGGTVTDDKGKGLPRMKVHASLRFTPRLLLYDFLRPPPETDERGRFVLRDLPPGVYQIHVDLPDGKRKSRHVATLDSTGGITNLHFAISAETVRISGTILSADRQALKSKPYFACLVDHPKSPFEVHWTDTGQTKEDGTFQLEGLPRRNGNLLFLGGDAGYAFTDPLRLSEGKDLSMQQILLQPGVALSGTVRKHGKIRGNPTVFLHTRQPDGSASDSLLATDCDLWGRFYLHGLPPGEYVASLSSAPPIGEVRFSTIASGEDIEVEVDMP